MLYLRIIIIAVNLLLFAYYVTVVGQSAGVLEFTPRELKEIGKQVSEGTFFENLLAV